MERVADLLLKAKKYMDNTIILFDDNTCTITVSVRVIDRKVYDEFKKFFEAVRLVTSGVRL